MILLVASGVLATITMTLLIMRPSWVLLVCLIAQVVVAAMQWKILKVSRAYDQ